MILRRSREYEARGFPFYLNPHPLRTSNASGLMDFVASEGGAFAVLGKSLNLAQQGYATVDYLKTGENKALNQQISLAQAQAQQAESIAAIEAMKAQQEAEKARAAQEKQTQMLFFGGFALLIIVGAIVYLNKKE